MLNLWSLQTWLTILIGFVTYYIASYFITIKRYPPGPLPLPILGNLLKFRGRKRLFDVFDECRSKYGDLYTIWLGHRPFVVLSSWKLSKETLAMKNYDIHGRIDILITRAIKENDNDIAFTDPSPEWETLRKIGFSAVRKFVGTEKLATFIYEVVEDVSEDMLKDTAGFDPSDYLFLMVYNVIASTAFGYKFAKDDKEFLEMTRINYKVRDLLNQGIPGDFVPLLRPFWFRNEQNIKRCIGVIRNFIWEKFSQRQETYKSGVIRDFSDAVLSAREEAIKEDYSCAQHMTEGSLRMVVANLFNAGVNTTQSTLRWILLFLVKYPEVQEKMAKEIEDNIGDRMAIQEDRSSLNYTRAVIFEVLRLRTTVPLGVPHKTISDTEFGGFKVPKDTGILFNIDEINRDRVHWENPNEFVPERFLEPDGKFTDKVLTHFMPFGMGRRSCIGEKMALVDMLLILVKLLQKCRLRLVDGIDSATLVPQNNPVVVEAQPYKIVAVLRHKN